ncbi:MAG: hypothetical protein RL238_3516 [Actinomycetota bacterium]|jgi:urease accessory protein
MFAALLGHVGGGINGLWDGLTHPVLGLDHVLAMVTVGVLAMTMARPLAAPATFLAGMIVGGALGLAGAPAPGGETAIALSVAALGVVLIVGRRLPAAWALGLIGVAGLAHGHAHGTEAPTAAHPVVYIAGFVVATAALHVVGAGVGTTVRDHTPARASLGAVVLGAGVGLVVGVI